jgi:hypothetical protein
VRNGSVPDGTYYWYYARNNDTWQKIAGTGNDGYNYWAYPDGAWYAQSSSGGPVLVKVDNNGSTSYMPLDRYVVVNPTGLTYDDLAEEDTNQVAIDNEMITTTVANPQSPDVASSEIQQAKNDIAAENQQTQQYENVYETAKQNNQAQAAAQNNAVGQQAINNERIVQGQAQYNINKVLFAPDCTGDDNVMDGCGDGNADTTDGGVGEGNG